jgi:hypothetical protein
MATKSQTIWVLEAVQKRKTFGNLSEFHTADVGPDLAHGLVARWSLRDGSLDSAFTSEPVVS